LLAWEPREQAVEGDEAGLAREDAFEPRLQQACFAPEGKKLGDQHGEIHQRSLSLCQPRRRRDRAAALEIVAGLEERGIRCWIAPRDVRPGSRFDDEIADALDVCRAMLLVFSKKCNENEYIRREVTVAGENRKNIIPIRIEKDARPLRGLRVRLCDLHWIDGFVCRERAIDELARNYAPLASKVERQEKQQRERTDTERRRQDEGQARLSRAIAAMGEKNRSRFSLFPHTLHYGEKRTFWEIREVLPEI
jgi:hypothetical protein